MIKQQTKLLTILLLAFSISGCMYESSDSDDKTPMEEEVSEVAKAQQETIVNSLEKDQPQLVVESASSGVNMKSSSKFIGTQTIDGVEVKVSRDTTTIETPVGEVDLKIDKSVDDEGNLMAIEFK